MNMPTILRRFLDWPGTLDNLYLPWWKILWRALWLPPLILSAAVLVLSVWASNGRDDAREVYRHLF